ncbi:MAG: cyclic pyranopterin monophosphate synthase MoaC [Bacteroidales bacterium]|jgi:cyclic pyranopterin phosphate synthase|nr:cyclic pyranopterin monophosphate synthase MoaC [Bacteroidales bacterium]
MKKLSHTDSRGKAIMVDIGEKEIQTRIAKARGHITLAAETIKLIMGNQLKKGDVLTVAQLAGINAAKQTQNLIPLCHNIAIENVKVTLAVDTTGVSAGSEVKSSGKTGVEMEALTAVSVALLTVYDMCKAVDKNMVIDRIELTEKIKK